MQVLNIRKDDISLEQVLQANDNFFAVLLPPPDESQDDLLYPNAGFEDGSPGVIDPVAPGAIVEHQAAPLREQQDYPCTERLSVTSHQGPERFMYALTILDDLGNEPPESFTPDEGHRFLTAKGILNEWRVHQAPNAGGLTPTLLLLWLRSWKGSRLSVTLGLGSMTAPPQDARDEGSAGVSQESEPDYTPGEAAEFYCPMHSLYMEEGKDCPVCITEENAMADQAWNETVNLDQSGDYRPPPVVGLPFGLTPGDWEDTLAFAPKYIQRVRRVREAGDTVVALDSYTMMMSNVPFPGRCRRDVEKTIFGVWHPYLAKEQRGQGLRRCLYRGRRVGYELRNGGKRW